MSYEIEKALLSCVLQDPHCCGQECLATFRSTNPFTNPIYRRIYHWWASHGKGEFDFILAMEALSKSHPETPWDQELLDVHRAVPTVAGYRRYIGMVAEAAEASRIAKGIQEAQSMLSSGKSAEEVRQYMSDLITNQIGTYAEHTDAKSAIDRAIRELSTDFFISTGFPTIDRMLSNIVPGEVMVIGARPSVGKTLFGGCLAKNMASSGVPVAFYSLEMPASQIIGRMVSASAMSDSRTYRQDIRDNPEVRKHFDYISSLPIYYNDNSAMTIDQIENSIRRMSHQYGIKAVVIDHIGLIRCRGRQRNEEVGEISRRLKVLAGEVSVLMIILCQLNRAVERGPDGKECVPLLSHLRESGSIEQDATWVIFPHRSVQLTEIQRAAVERGEPLDCNVIIAKNRHGPTGVRTLKMYLRSCLLTDERVEDKDIPSNGR